MNTEPNTTPDDLPVIAPSRGISIIWTLPLLALLICGWLLYESYTSAGIEITIVFDNATGITAKKTEVIASGIPVGQVRELQPDLENNLVRAKVLMNKDVGRFLVEDTLFWIVRPELSTAGIEGLETIFTGSYISIQAGSSKQSRHLFNGLQQAPPVPDNAPGLHLTLRAETLGSIQLGSGIYYKNIEIGTVQKYSLEGNQSILIDIFIEPQYASLVRDGSRFCNASGITISGKVTNLRIQVESLASLIRGGILLQTPDMLMDSEPAKNGQFYPLYKDYEAANFGIAMTLQLASGVDIVEGVTKVMYRGIEAGFVKEIQINNDEHRTVTAHLLLDPRAELILRDETVFWMVKPQLTATGFNNLRTLLSGPHITFKPGDGEFRNHFVILPKPPHLKPLRPGTSFVLASDKGLPISLGAPVLFQEVQVGEVIDIDLAPEGESIQTSIFIYQPYDEKVAANSVFWLTGGIEFSANTSGVSLQTGPLAKMVLGGIGFASPSGTDGPILEEDIVFQLYPSEAHAGEAAPFLLPKGLRFQLQTDAPGSLEVGSPIYHRNIAIGRVSGISFHRDNQSVLIDCFIEEQYNDLFTADTKFYPVSGIEISGGLDGVKLKMESLLSAIKGGIACITSADSSPIKPSGPLPLYASLDAALHAGDLEITIHFDEPGGLKVGSPLRYKGIDIGQVTDMEFTGDLKQVVLTARIRQQLAELFKNTTLLYLVKPKISLSGVKNLDAVLPGPYIQVVPGDGAPRKEFFARQEPPRFTAPTKPGLLIVLESPRLGSLTLGSPLYYRQLQVGEVTGYELAQNFQTIFIAVTIKPRYRTLVQEKSRFWNISGARLEGSLFSGISIATNSLESVLRGGIAMANPNTDQESSMVSPGHHFLLYEKAEEEWLEYDPVPLLQGTVTPQ